MTICPMFSCRRHIVNQLTAINHRSYSSDRGSRWVPQKTLYHHSKLQFGPIVRSKAQDRKAKRKPVKISTSESESLSLFDRTENSGVSEDINTRRGEDSVLRIPLSRTESAPSVSKILKETMDQESRAALQAWEQRKVMELGVEGFSQLKKETFQRGHAIHSWLEHYLLTGERSRSELHGDDVTERHVQSVTHLLDKVSDVKVLESATVHPQLNYCGVVDCVAKIGSTLCVIDWKTSERTKPTLKSLYDNPLQVVAYLGSLNADPRYASLGRLEAAAVVVIYNSGYPAVIHKLSKNRLQQLWSTWLKRLQLFRKLNS